MLKFNSVQCSSDLTTISAKQKIEMDARVTKEKLAIASNLISDFLDRIMEDTLTNQNPKQLYEYDIDPDVDVKHLRVYMDDIVYHIFKHNMYAIPDIFCKESTDVKPVGKIVIHASNTVRFISATDVKLEREITDLLSNDTLILQSKKAVVYTGFDHLVSQLPNAYATSRCKSIMDILKDKGYCTHWEPVSMYMTISIK